MDHEPVRAHDIAHYLHGLASIIDWDQTPDGDDRLGMRGDQYIVISDADGGIGWTHYVSGHAVAADRWTSEASWSGFDRLRRYIAHVTDGMLRNERMKLDPWDSVKPKGN